MSTPWYGAWTCGDGTMRQITDRQYGALMIAGNHLASFLIQNNVLPNHFTTYGEVLESQGMNYADAWVGWKAIMDIRNECEANNA